MGTELLDILGATVLVTRTLFLGLALGLEPGASDDIHPASEWE